MEVKVCKNCKSLFQYITGTQICPKCKKLEEEMFQSVKEYLRQNPGESMNIVSEETKVSVSLIEKFLRQGRLEVSPDSQIALTCEMCGRKITTGRFCSGCKGELKQELSQVRKEIIGAKKEEENKQDTAKMRFLHSNRIK